MKPAFFISVLLVFSLNHTCAAHPALQKYSPHNYIPEAGYVPDRQTAAQIAQAVLVPIYGKAAIESQKPFRVERSGDRWIISGQMKEFYPSGTALIVIHAMTVQILRVTHGKQGDTQQRAGVVMSSSQAFQFTWIRSDGGPFILGEPSVLQNWQGSGGLSLLVDSPAFGGIEPNPLVEGWAITDYSYACSFTKELDTIYAGKLPGYGPGRCIVVISDAPSDIAWYPTGQDSGYIVKWVGAHDEEQILRGLINLPDACFASLGLTMQVQGARGLVAFDSAYSLMESIDNTLTIDLPPAAYRLSFGNIDQPDLELHIIRIAPAN